MGVLPPTMMQLFAIGDESGSLDELMREISVHYQSEVDYAIKRLSATLEPILIWFKNGEIKDLASASDMQNISALSRPVVKHYLCSPEED